MPESVRTVLTVLGRLMIAGIFLASAVGNKIPNYSGVVQYMEKHHVPAPQILLAGAILFLLVGSVSIILGYKAKVGATMLLIFLAAATWYFHGFWRYEGADRQMQTIQFMKNASLMGTMLFLIANGSGAGSLDARRKS